MTAAVPLDDLVHTRLLDLEPKPDSDPRPLVDRLVGDLAPLLAPNDHRAAVDRVVARVNGLGPLEPLLAEPQITDIMINGPGPVWIERDGVVVATDTIVDADTIDQLIERVVGPLGLRVDRSSPIVDARLADGSRVNAVLPPLAVDGPYLSIRRFGARRVPLDEVCPPGVADLLRWAIAGRMNMVVTGGSGAGKTTLLNALAGEIDRSDRIVTIEDAAELRLQAAHVVRLEARPATADGLGSVTVRDLVRNALRMRPDRLVVGEVRGPEALDMIQALNTGHVGSLTTAHANSAADGLLRLETMALMADVGLPLVALRQQLRSAVDLIIHVVRTPAGARRVVAVVELETDATSGTEVRTLADASGMVAHPARPARTPGHPEHSTAGRP